MTPEESSNFEKRRKQRVVEYVILVGFQGFFVTAFIPVFHLLFSPLFAIITCGLAWNLASLREQRRTLAVGDSRRLIGDALESMILLLALVLLGIGAQYMAIQFVVIMAHLAISLLGYFVGSLLGEGVWMRRNVAALPPEKLHNYIENLNRSLFFPYNLQYLQRVFRRPRRRDDDEQ